jgi:hypothetical protein
MAAFPAPAGLHQFGQIVNLINNLSCLGFSEIFPKFLLGLKHGQPKKF